MSRTNRRDEKRTDDPTDRPDEKTGRTPESPGRTMRDVSHTHPFTERGAINRPFERGPVVAADGGERNAVEHEAADEESEADEEAEAENGKRDRMKDVDHTPPHGDGVNRVYERGKEEPVESEE